MTTTTRIVEVRKDILKHNDERARALRRRFEQTGVFVVSLVSSPGSGKTAFLEKTLARLKQAGHRPAAVVGDLATENDAARLARSQAPVKQITTGTLCHLEAAMVESALAGTGPARPPGHSGTPALPPAPGSVVPADSSGEPWDLASLDFLFIENVGNLVCPSSYDLGEALRVVLLSVTEGEDKPLKYPTIFNTGDLAILTKIDLAEACEFDRAAAVANIQSVRPGMPVMEVSAKTGSGMDQWIHLLLARACTRS